MLILDGGVVYHMRGSFIQLILILVTATLSVGLSHSQIRSYEFEIGAGLFIVLFILKLIGIKSSPIARYITACTFTFVAIFIVVSTGGSNSAFFFLMYFLLFALALLLDPSISIILTIYLIVLFISLLKENQDMKALLPIISLGFISPFALLLGSEYQKLQKENQLNQKIEEETLLFLSLTVKKHLDSIDNIIQNFQSQTDLQSIHNQTKLMRKLINKFDTQLENEVNTDTTI